MAGGDGRHDSVRAGLDSLGGCDWVIVHDGARPLVTPDLIAQGLDAARETGASCCAVPVPDSIKESNEAGEIVRTVERSRLCAFDTFGPAAAVR